MTTKSGRTSKFPIMTILFFQCFANDMGNQADRMNVSPKPTLQVLSGKGLARYLDEDPARFQPLPRGTAREVFPQAARPVRFTPRVRGRGGPGDDFP